MTTTAIKVANALIQKAAEDERPFTNMKLQKLVYLAYGWHFAIADEKLFDDEIQAWRYGPVIPSLYQKFKLYFSNPIPSNHYFVPESTELPELVMKIVDKVWESYGNYDAGTLVELTHQPESPWHRAYCAGQLDIQISDDDINSHYKELLSK